MSSHSRAATSKAAIGPASPTRISFDEKTIEEALRRAERDSDRRRSWRNRELMLEERKKCRSTIEEESENEDEVKDEVDIARIRANAMAALEGRSTPQSKSHHRRHRSYQGDRSYFTAQDVEYSRPMTATIESYSRPKTAIIDTSLRRPEFTPGKRSHSKTSIDNSASLPSSSRRKTTSIDTNHLSKIQFSSTPPFFPPHPLHSNPVLMTPDSSSSEEEEEPEMEEHVVIAWDGNTLIEKKVMKSKNGSSPRSGSRRPSSMTPSMTGSLSPLSPMSPLTPITPFSPSPSSRPRPRPKSAICTSTSRTTIMRDSSMRDTSPPMPPLIKTSTTLNGRTRSNSKSQVSLECRLSRTGTGDEKRRSRTDEVDKLRQSAKNVLLEAPKMPSKKTSLTSFRDPDVLEKELRRKSGLRGLSWLNWS